jgi:hypothetical protein
MHMHGSRSRSVLVRWGLGVIVLSLLLGVFAPPAAAQTRRKSDGPRVVLTGRVEVGANERTDTVVIFDGPAVIDGDVNGAVVAFNGDVRVRGNVDEAVVVFRGRAIIEEGATVGEDVVSSRPPRVAPGATVNGDVRRVRFANAFRALGWLLWLAWWLAVSVSTFVLGLLVLLLAPRVATASLAVARARVGPAVGWGLATAIGLPIVSILLLVTLVGIPLGLIGLLSLALLYGLGYVVAALVLGRRLIREPSSLYVAYVVGLLILRVIDLVPVLGNLITAAATVFGLGVLTVAAWRAARGKPLPARSTPVDPTTPTAAP